MRFLLFHESIHIIFTTVLSLFLYYKFKNWKLVLVAFFVVIFLDIDHLLDYGLYEIKTGIFTFPFATDYFHGSQKVLVLLHGWELSIPLLIAGKKIGSLKNIRGLEWTIVLSYLGHLIVDQLSYSPHLLGYSLIFRILTNFDISSFHNQ